AASWSRFRREIVGREELVPGRLVVEPLDRVEQVAVQQLRIEAGEGLGLRDVVQADPIPDCEYRSALTRFEREALPEQIEIFLARLEDVRLRAGRRGRVKARRLRAH